MMALQGSMKTGGQEVISISTAMLTTLTTNVIM